MTNNSNKGLQGKITTDFHMYERGKQTATLLINFFILAGFVMEIISFHKLYVPLQLILQLITTGIYISTFILLLIDRKRFYVICYLILTYLLISNIIIYDILFPGFIAKLHFLRSEFFSRNLFIILPFVAILGFIAGTRHIVIQGAIIVAYVGFQMIWNNDDFIKASGVNYLITVIGFSWVSYFLVNANQRFIKELNETNLKLKETQQQLIQSEKMASLGTLTAGVAHEINNPLNFINGGIQIISDINQEMNNNIPEEIQDRYKLAAKMISTGFERTSVIVKALMNFSHRGNSSLINSSLTDIIENTLLFLKSKITGDIEVIKQYDFTEPVPVYPSKVHQLILNIIDNAIFAVKLENIGVKRILISTNSEGQKAIIRISNSGPPIPENILSQIFDPFFTTKEPGEGTGLGLAICYSIIAEHNGNIYVKNSQEGVIFQIELPLGK